MSLKDQTIEQILQTVENRPATVAIILEESCIGCFKCINACPVDAIIGSPQKMHTVISDHCIGCDLCIEACPVNCIVAEPLEKQINAITAKQRNQQKLDRLKSLSDYEKQIYSTHTFQNSADPLADKKSAIAAAVARANKKK